MQVKTKNRLLEFLSLMRKEHIYEIRVIQKEFRGFESTLIEDRLKNKLLEIHQQEIFNTVLEHPSSLPGLILETFRKGPKKEISKCLEQVKLVA